MAPVRRANSGSALSRRVHAPTHTRTARATRTRRGGYTHAAHRFNLHRSGHPRLSCGRVAMTRRRRRGIAVVHGWVASRRPGGITPTRKLRPGGVGGSRAANRRIQRTRHGRRSHRVVSSRPGKRRPWNRAAARLLELSIASALASRSPLALFSVKSRAIGHLVARPPGSPTRARGPQRHPCRFVRASSEFSYHFVELGQSL